MMKKILALVLTLMMMLGACAVAETAEAPFEGTWVQFPDGFEILLPSDWLEYEVGEELRSVGIFFVAASPDGARTCQIGWSALEAEMTIEQVQADMAGTYPDATIVEVNGINLVAYTDAANNLMGCVALDAAEPGIYMFFFTPGDDAEYQEIASWIAASIRNIEE